MKKVIALVLALGLTSIFAADAASPKADQKAPVEKKADAKKMETKKADEKKMEAKKAEKK